MTGIGALRSIHDSIGNTLFGGSSDGLETIERITNNVAIPLLDATSRAEARVNYSERGIPQFSRGWGHRGGWNRGYDGFGPRMPHYGRNFFPGMQTGPGIPSSIPRYMAGTNGFRGGVGDAIGMTRSRGNGLVAMTSNGDVISSRNGVMGSVGQLGEAYDRNGCFQGGGAPDGTILDKCNRPIGYVDPAGMVFNRCNDPIGRVEIPGGMRGEHAAAYARLAYANQLG